MHLILCYVTPFPPGQEKWPYGSYATGPGDLSWLLAQCILSITDVNISPAYLMCTSRPDLEPTSLLLFWSSADLARPWRRPFGSPPPLSWNVYSKESAGLKVLRMLSCVGAFSASSKHDSQVSPAEFGASCAAVQPTSPTNGRIVSKLGVFFREFSPIRSHTPLKAWNQNHACIGIVLFFCTFVSHCRGFAPYGVWEPAFSLIRKCNAVIVILPDGLEQFTKDSLEILWFHCFGLKVGCKETQS